MDTRERYCFNLADSGVEVVLTRSFNGRFIVEFNQPGGNLDGFTCDHPDPDELQELALGYAQMAARMERGH